MSRNRVADEEDVVLSAFNSFFEGAKRGMYPSLEDEDSLWRILVVLTNRKAIDSIEKDRRLKRGGGKVRGESVFVGASGDSDGPGLQAFIGRDPNPEQAAEFIEETRRLLGMLPDDTLRTIVIRKMEGHTSHEIAKMLDVSPRTIKRKLQVIRGVWVDEYAS